MRTTYSDGDKSITRGEFEKLRSHDPHLSPMGERQIGQLGAGIQRALFKPLSPKVRELKKQSSGLKPPRVTLAVSPMRRTLLTAVPVVSALEELHTADRIHLKEVEIVPYLYEIGGCYSEHNGMFVGHPGMTGKQALEILPTAKVPPSMDGGWWTSSTRETDEELELRVAKTLEWIRRTACEGQSDVLIIVIHQDFACMCMRRLAQVPGVSWLYNTSFSSFTLRPVLSGAADQLSVDQMSDGSVTPLHHCNVVVDWINSVDHLSFENLT